MQTLLEQAQYLADEAQNISDRIADIELKDAIPLDVIAADVAAIMYEFAKLRSEILKEYNDDITTKTI